MYKKIVAQLMLATLLICPGLAAAFGLGEIDIKSALNQPMNAEIELVGFNPDEIDEVRVELADQQMFERVGVPRPYILTRLKFVPSISAGKPVIKVTSSESIREPFLTFLIDVRWSKGKLLREYTVLLDPPVFGDKAKAKIQAPKVVTKTAPRPKPAAVPKKITKAQPRQQQVTTPRAAPKPKATPIAESPPPEPLKKTDQPVSVKRGDTLWSIAEPYARQKGVSVNQMMLAIQAANPQGFDQNNINNLKSGVILRIPADAASRFSDREALAEVQRQWQAWKQGSQPVKETDSAVNVDAGEPVEDQQLDAPAMPASETTTSDSKLSILGEDDVSEGKSGDDAQAKLNELRNQVNLLKENSESKLQENSELKDRIESLESMIKKQEDIISLQNEQLAQLQNTLTTDTEGMAADIAAEEVIQEESDEPSVGEQEQQSEVAEIKPAQVEPLPDFSGPIPEEFLNAEQAASEDKPESLIAEAEVKETETPVEQPQAEKPQASMLDRVIAIVKEQAANLKYALIALVVALLGWLGLRRRNASRNEETIAASGLPAFEDEPSIDEMLDETVVATPDSVDQALDELDEVLPEDSADQEEIGDSESADDVLAEADVYISYGLYQQAEELLKDGLAKEPSNVSYQLKLAEIYHGDKKTDEFVQHVESIESGLDKSSPEWLKLASMGAAIAPAHALFAGSETSSDAVADSDSSEAIGVASEDDASEFNMESDEEIENFDSDNLDDNSLDFTFGDDADSVSDVAEDEIEDSATAVLETDLDFDAEDEIDESSTALLEDSVDLDSGEATQAFAVDDELLGNANQAEDSNTDSDEVFLDFDQDELEGELNTTHDSETEMLDESIASGVDIDDAINLEDNLETESFESDSGTKIDNDLEEMLENDGSETAMFDSSLFDVDSAEADPLEDTRVDEDTVSLEQVQENLTAELETLSFDSDIDPEKIEEDSLPTLQTSEMGKPDLDDMDDNLAASETGTFEADMMADSVTEQFDVGNIDSTMTDLGEFGGDDELENPSVIEEVGTKLDLAKAFVDMGDEDAAKETLTEVIEQGDSTQIQEAKDLLDKLH